MKMGKVHNMLVLDFESANVSALPPQVMLVDFGDVPKNQSGKIRVVSVSTPQPGKGERKKSLRGNAVVRVALASSVNTEDISRLNRTRLKLRQWKAKLLAEPPPLVEIEFNSNNSTEAASEFETESKCEGACIDKPKDHALKRRAAQLEFAKRNQRRHHESLVREVKAKRAQHALTAASKKEFGPILPSQYQ
eukprot:gb/GECG01009996.1/.p1 GENE.gb/GECG01009996.1/~~gb/GECG01009996.1/.p1  ORF type:complete len:192 (+),score=27.60 gb/GECG01009996.1/:1-576(+)